MGLTNWVNLTPHEVNIVGGPTFRPSGSVARCSTVTVAKYECDGVTVAVRDIGPLEGLPDPQPGTMYIVSAMAREAAEAMGRTDCVSPGLPVRDLAGRIIGCHDLQCAPAELTIPGLTD